MQYNRRAPSAMEFSNQKEYLKKYLSGGGKDKKKKKRKRNDALERVKIIDDDIELSEISVNVAEDLYSTNEDAPQIVGVIDERPMHMRIDDYRQSDLWRPLGAATANETAEDDFKQNTFQKEKEILLKLIKKDSGNDFKSISLNKLQKSRSKSHIDKDRSQVQRWNLDNNLCRRERSPSKDRNDVDKCKLIHECDESNKRNGSNNEDNSISQKSGSYEFGPEEDDDRSSICTINKQADSSPPRRLKRTSNNKVHDIDINYMDSVKTERHNSVSVDNSPPRKSMIRDSSPPRKIKTNDKQNLERRNEQRGGSVRRSDCSDIVPKRKLLPGDKKGKYLIPAKRMSKTLDGKTAGLQNARELIDETEAFRKRENDLFKSMSSEVSGVNATTVMRDRKTGKVRDLKKEEEERAEKRKQEEMNKEKYSRWGKGLKQVEEYENKLQQDLLEMNKPLARYADDEDLERHLKEQERDGDPMLDYIRKKRRKKDVETGKPTKPRFEGEFMPNRFGIRPGHRWDGVDRSNGYEKKWIEVQNAKHAIQEEVYKWSTEDM